MAEIRQVFIRDVPKEVVSCPVCGAMVFAMVWVDLKNGVPKVDQDSFELRCAGSFKTDKKLEKEWLEEHMDWIENNPQLALDKIDDNKEIALDWVLKSYEFYIPTNSTTIYCREKFRKVVSVQVRPEQGSSYEPALGRVTPRNEQVSSLMARQ